MALTLPAIPAVLKPIHHFLKVASEHEKRDPVITYWCRLYALQSGMGIDKSNESLAVLLPLMDWLENTKKASASDEAIIQDVVAQAHVENYANRLFLWADKEDRAARFNKNVVKAFYTAGVIFDVCETFGELSVEVQEQRKYAKWKAAYIHNCLKSGEQPKPGPAVDEDEEGEVSISVPHQPQEPGPSEPHAMGFQPPVQPSVGGYPPQPPAPSVYPPQHPASSPYQPQPPAPNQYQPQPPAANPYQPQPPAPNPYQPQPPAATPPAPTAGGPAVTLGFEQITKAQKYSKLAYSALNYEDVPTAVTNLQKALNLLQTGQES